MLDRRDFIGLRRPGRWGRELDIGREIARAGRSVIVVERGTTLGGPARTFRRDGYSVDLGDRRFHSNNPDVVSWPKTLMGDDLLRVERAAE